MMEAGPPVDSVSLHVDAPPASKSGGGLASALASASPRPPNLLLVTLDDVGLNDLGYLSTDLPGITPHMDALALDGVRLTNYYGQSLCTPARAALMSGKFGHRTGIQDSLNFELAFNSNFSVPLRHKLLPAHLKDLGYATYGVGKWNVGFCNEAYLPTSRGFDWFLGYHSSGVGYYDWTVPNLFIGSGDPSEADALALDMLNMTADGRGGSKYEPAVPSGYRDGLPYHYTDLLFRNEALRVHGRHARDMGDVPYFMWYAPHGPHSDMASFPPDDLLTHDVKEALHGVAGALGKQRAAFAMALAATDGALGQIVDALSADGPLVVAVSSDNGGDPCANQFEGNNYPYKGGKKTFYEGGVHLPAFLWANDAAGLFADSRATALSTGRPLRGAAYDGLFHHVDWIATLSSLAGASAALDGDYDSVDQTGNLFFGGDDDRPAPVYLALFSNPTVVVDNGWKLLHNARASVVVAPDANDDDTCDSFSSKKEIAKQFFNLRRDPYEANNTYTDDPAIHDAILKVADEAYAVQANLPSPPFSPPVSDYVHGDLQVLFQANHNTLVPWGCPVYH